MLTKRKPDLQLFLNRLTSRSVLSEREKNAVLDLPGDTMLIPEGNDFIRLRETVEHTSLILHGLSPGLIGIKTVTGRLLRSIFGEICRTCTPSPNPAQHAPFTPFYLQRSYGCRTQHYVMQPPRIRVFRKHCGETPSWTRQSWHSGS